MDKGWIASGSAEPGVRSAIFLITDYALLPASVLRAFLLRVPLFRFLARYLRRAP